jgi:uncharacterized protein (DUF342 family)
MIPIPFFGWLAEDDEDKKQMLREQIHMQEHRIKQLEGLVMALQEECSALIKQIGEVK